MRRKLFTLLSAASLVLCLTVCAARVRSGATADRLNVWHGAVKSAYDVEYSAGFEITHVAGALKVRHLDALGRDGPAAGRRWKWRTLPAAGYPLNLSTRGAFLRNVHTFAGFEIGSNRQEWDVIVPDYAIVFMTAILPAWWAWRAVRKWRRYGAGHCAVCGYDLRASPSRCPECGAEARPAQLGR